MVGNQTQIKQINILNYFLFGCFLVFLGLISYNSGQNGIKNSFNIIGVAFLALGFSHIIRAVVKRVGNKPNVKVVVSLQNAMINLLFGLTILSLRRVDVFIFSFICAIYILFIGMTKLTGYILYKGSEDKFNFVNLIFYFIYTICGIGLLFAPNYYVDYLVKVIAVWLILYGISYWSYCINELITSDQKDSVKRKIRLPLPVFIAAIVPDIVLNNINKFFELRSPDAKINQTKIIGRPDLEVLIHLSPKGFNRMGHVDIAYKGEIIAYGNYDESSSRFFDMVGDGVLFFADKRKYVPLAIKASQKTLVSFGLKLNKNQKQAFERKLDEIKNSLYEWTPDSSKTANYSSKLKSQAKAKFFKFKKGKFKNYFVLGTNCVLLADQLIGVAGLDIVKINGIITPGSYYDCLNQEFYSRNNLVVSRKIYR